MSERMIAVCKGLFAVTATALLVFGGVLAAWLAARRDFGGQDLNALILRSLTGG